MSPLLQSLLNAARKIPVDAAMHEEQIRSFAYGNVKLSNPTITREMVDKEIDKILDEMVDDGK